MDLQTTAMRSLLNTQIVDSNSEIWDFELFKYRILSTVKNAIRLVFSITRWLPFQFFVVAYLSYGDKSFLHAVMVNFITLNRPIQIFVILFLFKYVKVVVHIISFLLYRPYAIPDHPTVRPKNVTIIIPTIGNIDEPEFRETLNTIFRNHPYEVIISTVGKRKADLANRVIREEFNRFKTGNGDDTKIRVIESDVASKRHQIFIAIPYVRTSIVSLADDHVFWGDKYLTASIAPFEDPRIGGVGTNKRVRREPFEWTWQNFLNFIACNYLERHNFECTASVNIDHGLFVLSGRTAFYRTDIFRHPDFEKSYMQETWWFGTVGRGGFAVDDDNLLTRFTIGTAKYKCWFQNSEASTMETTLGDPGKFFGQMDRWIRTTWRSNLTSIFSDQTVWKTQPWSVYAIYLSSFVNLALFYDPALLISCYMGLKDFEYTLGTRLPVLQAMALLLSIIFLSKMVKPLPHFWRHPDDVWWIPEYLFFGYYHSIIKLKALVTVHIIAWGTRPGV